MATNRADTLDPALLRPGRLDRKIEFPLPDRRQKRLIFSTITSKMNLSDEVDLEDCMSSAGWRARCCRCCYPSPLSSCLWVTTSSLVACAALLLASSVVFAYVCRRVLKSPLTLAFPYREQSCRGQTRSAPPTLRPSAKRQACRLCARTDMWSSPRISRRATKPTSPGQRLSLSSTNERAQCA